ncbi:MAG: purine-nucleoside phosphorylase [Spirochaetota bacterium]
MSYASLVEEAAGFVRGRTSGPADCAVVLGSGLGALAGMLEEPAVLPYRDIPGFPRATIPGHRGELVTGRLGGRRLAVLNGRFHYYQGCSLQEVTLPVRVAARLGAGTCILSNAAGGINPELRSGDIMLIRDHINFMGDNPLRGLDPREFGTGFVDMSEPYDLRLLQEAARAAAADPRVGPLREGVYLAVAGPSYETRAEIDFFEKAGADAVGMSTVPEVIVCRQEGVRVLGISAIVNPATGRSRERLDHREVVRRAGEMSGRLTALIRLVVEHVL